MTRFRKTAGALTAAAFVMSLVVLAPTPAAATHVNCGVITQSVTLPRDVRNCEGYGLIIRADNVTVNLNRHTVSCNNTYPEQVGILLDNVRNVTVMNGTVEGCDAGVSIEGGSGNTVRQILARNNVNDMAEPFDPFGPPPPGFTMADIQCDYGDGIVVFDSSNNLIERNWAIGNGPYSGISLVEEGSDGNVVRDNRVEENDLLNYRPGVTPQQTSLCGATQPGTPGMQRGRNNQDIGIRIEGPGADRNHVVGNQVTKSALAGISVHSHVCNPQPGDPRGVTDPNTFNVIDRNTVTRTGNDTFAVDPTADGIGLLAQGPIGNVTCGSNDNTVIHNRSNDNRRHGILVNVDNTNNTVSRNQVNNNDRDGIFVATHGSVPASNNLLQENRGTGNGEHDGHDANPDCDANRWIANQFAVVNQPCVDRDATVVPVAAPAEASASASATASDEDSGNVNRGPRSS